jgi:ABC-2 type transport system ATP-binding protein
MKRHVPSTALTMPSVPSTITSEPESPGWPGTTTPAAFAVRTDRLTRDYGGSGLFDVSLAVPCGSVYGLVGPNGAGKTTLLSILTGVRQADHGAVHLGLNRRAMATCPDVPEFDGWLTAFEVVDLARVLVTPHRNDDAVLRALASAGLTAHADRRVGDFSRGMIQRLGLAAALAGDPQLLVLDEPTSALDPAGRNDILSLVAGLRGRRTIIFSSHILADVQRVADHVGVLRDGRLLYQGTTQALVDAHLRPRWHVRVAGGVEHLHGAFAAQPWVTEVADVPDGLVVNATNLEAGERGIPAVMAAADARMVSCEPIAADLESAFLSLTGDTGK